jgi:hypothetical protein
MTQALVKVEEKALVVSQGQSALEELGVSASDLAIAKILLMQSTSEMVGDGKANFGDMVNSLTGDKLGSIGKPVEILPLAVNKSWVIFDMSSGQPEFLRTEAFTAANANQPWEGEEDGKPVRRDQSINVYVLLVSEITSGEAFPLMVSFRRTGYAAGKALVTQILKQKMFKKPIYARTVMLDATRQKNGTNTYAVFEVKPSRPTTEAEQATAEALIEMLSTQKPVVDESDLRTPEPSAAPKPVVIKTTEGTVDEVY